MGVRGLTTFINQRACQCYEDYQLKDCQLVIDGSSLASQLYISKCSFNSAFGGDYDRYALSIREFFKNLKKCKVSPIVILDGGYEKRKLKTIYSRMKGKWQLVKTYTPASQLTNNVFPCFLKETFKDVVKELRIPFAQSLFEADEEIAAVARILNCPVLSYDSDFFVFNVLYIPFPTLNLHPHKDNSDNAKKDDYYLRCSLYRMETFLKQFGGLQKELLPLFAVLLGNDYISNRVFRSFINQFKHKKGKINRKQKKIVGLLHWLQGETFESAFVKLSKFIRGYKRKPITTKIKKEVANYITAQCSLLGVLGIDEAPIKSDTTDKLLTLLEGGGGANEEVEEIVEDDSEEEDVYSQEETDEEEMDYDDDDDEEEEEEDDDDDDDDDGGDERQQEQQSIEKREEHEGEVAEGGEAKTTNSHLHVKGNGRRRKRWEHRMAAKLPQWFLERFQRCDLPSTFMDVIILRALFSPAQMEDLSVPPAHATGEAVVHQLVALLLERGPQAEPWRRQGTDVRWLLRGEDPCRRVNPSSWARTTPSPPLHALPSLSGAQRLLLLLEPVGDAVDKRALGEVPERWRLLAVSVAAWISSAEPRPTPVHVDVLLLSLVLLDVVASHFKVSCAGRRPMRRKTQQTALVELTPQKNQAEGVGNELLSEEDGVVGGEVRRVWAQVRASDCEAALRALRPLCVMEERLKTRPKLFCVATTHAFAQWQSAFLNLGHLNMLLGYPLAPCPVHRIFNGTFAYNATHHLRGRHGTGDSVAAVARLLDKAPSVLAFFKAIRTAMYAAAPKLQLMESEGPERPQGTSRVSRTKKKKKKKKVLQQQPSSHLDRQTSHHSGTSETEFEDPCNRFSALNISG